MTVNGDLTDASSVATRVAGRRLRHLVAGGWGAVSGVAPHVLHHVGPLAGAAILAGTGGRVLFFLIGLAAAIPMLIRLYRRFRTWIAPAIAIAVFGVTYTFSSLFIGPLISGEADPTTPDDPAATSTPDQHGH